MKAYVPEKMIAIADEIRIRRYAKLTRLTVLKKWFNPSKRLVSFGIYIAKRAQANGTKRKPKGEAAELFREVRSFLRGVSEFRPVLPREKARELYQRLRAFQNEYDHYRWGAIRKIHNWDLLLVEKGLHIYLSALASPSEGYQLAADYCRHYDSSSFEALNGPSRDRILEIVRFMRKVEALENGGSDA